MSELLVFPKKAEQPSVQRFSPSASVPSVRISPDVSPASGARNGEISDVCQRNIVELFARRFVRSIGRLCKPDPLFRYITTFDKDRLALGGAYASEATFSCRFISSSPEPPPYYLNTGTLFGSPSIIEGLSSLSRRIIFIPGAEFDLDATIDTLQLPDMSYFVALAFNTIIEGIDVSVDMAFLLKENARVTGNQNQLRVLWAPFVVISHQMILRS